MKKSMLSSTRMRVALFLLSILLQEQSFLLELDVYLNRYILEQFELFRCLF